MKPPKVPRPPDAFRWFDSSPEVIRLVVMMYVRSPLSLRNVEDLLFERGSPPIEELGSTGSAKLAFRNRGPYAALRQRVLSHLN